MKKQNLIISVLAVTLTSVMALAPNNSEPSNDTARVQRVQGKYVFVMSEPTMDYEVVEELGTGGQSVLIGKQSIDDQINNMIRRGLKKYKKGEITEFDAIVTSDGKRGALIKFK